MLKSKITAIMTAIIMIICTIQFPGEINISALTDGDWTYTVSDNTATITGYTGKTDKMVIPEKINGYPVMIIGSNAFKNNTDIIEVTLPKTIQSLGNYAFRDCSSLKNINLNEGLLTLGYGTFYQCTSLESIIIPDSVTTINSIYNDGSSINIYYKQAFGDCKNLKAVVLGDSLKMIESGTFVNCSALESVKFGKGLKSIEGYAFTWCENLKEVNLSETQVTTIGNDAFRNCTRLKDIKLSNYLETIGVGAFYDCQALDGLVIPGSIKVIYSDHFYQTVGTAPNLDGSTINKCIKNTFGYCIGIKNLTIGGGEIQPFAFNACTGLESLTLKEGITTIGSYAFSDCYSLKSVILPHTLTTLGSYAFRYCRELEWVAIPYGLKDIPSNAFGNTKPETIFGYENSSAKTFAEANSIEFYSLGEYDPNVNYPSFENIIAQIEAELNPPHYVPKNVWNGTADTSWFDGKSNEYDINTAEQLAGLSLLVSEGNDMAGITINLINDIFLNDTFNWEKWGAKKKNGIWKNAPENMWTPIGISDYSGGTFGYVHDILNPFSGTFNGNGHKISGLYTEHQRGAGLFGYIKGAVITGILLDEGCIIGDNSEYDVAAGGIVGVAEGSLVFECENRAKVIAVGPAGVQSGLHYTYAGGIVGQIRTEDNSALLNGNDGLFAGSVVLLFSSPQFQQR